ncbi:MAG: citramalate synthase [Clostridia bacterium]|nr:citramalate synthase [Clostridia bacterium]
MEKIYTLDTTLRDGLQAQTVSFSLKDKLKIIRLLDKLGVDFIEVGNPAFGNADEEFFKCLDSIKTVNSKIVTFSPTCRVGEEAKDSVVLNSIVNTNVKYCTVFGKAWKLHVDEVLKTTEEENLRMIKDSIEYLRSKGKIVFFDGEHFFDGYKDNHDYAIEVLKTAASAGADTIVLCDTNGGSFPDDIKKAVREVSKLFGAKLGIHVHNDCDMAVANSVVAASCGCVHIQGTLNGIGERCGNANLATIIANLQLKKGFKVLPENNMERLTETSRAVAQITNLSTTSMPYISRNAFAHKAGMHVDAVMKNPVTFEHIDPSLVGNKRNFILSEISGKSALFNVVRKVVPDMERDDPKMDGLLKVLKQKEADGYHFEVAQESLELLIKRQLGLHKPFFEVEKLKLIDEQITETSANTSYVFIKVSVNGTEEIAAAESDGPLHALDQALRKALCNLYPSLQNVRMTDYKVRVLESRSSTGSKVRVLIECSDGVDVWNTVGVSVNIIEASKMALFDAIEYKLMKDTDKEPAPEE